MVVAVAFYVLSAAMLAGIVLALLHLSATSPAQRPPRMGAAAHGAGGAIGVVLLLIALRDKPRGVLNGAASFRLQAAVFLGGAILTGIGIIILARRGGEAIFLMMVVHGLLAVTGYVLLAAYVSLD
jgi:hypothetical protein